MFYNNSAQVIRDTIKYVGRITFLLTVAYKFLIVHGSENRNIIFSNDTKYILIYILHTFM